jgi:hypothetical protein
MPKCRGATIMDVLTLLIMASWTSNMVLRLREDPIMFNLLKTPIEKTFHYFGKQYHL